MTPSSNHHEPLFHRHVKNPILTAADWPYAINTVFNAGATTLQDGRTLLLCRIEDRRGHSHLCAARSKNGIDGWEVDPAPTMMPDPDNFPEELWGIEDPRITYMPDLGKYAIVYTAFSAGAVCVAGLDHRFYIVRALRRHHAPEDKGRGLAAEEDRDYWALFHRPSAW